MVKKITKILWTVGLFASIAHIGLNMKTWATSLIIIFLTYNAMVITQEIIWKKQTSYVTKQTAPTTKGQAVSKTE